ncbi:hypothetical protein [Grimontia indica]|uniref:hypothetical protein n=1 Tax=Grimontia indica TaxID=1056512 RepID=UPI000586517C|nr:hypothetical protein [Grimontia indica]
MKKKLIAGLGPFSDFLASLSIIAAASLFAFDFIESRKSDIEATIVHGSNKEVTLFLSNTGGKDIVIKSAFMVVPSYEIHNEINLGEVGTLIKSGETIVKRSKESNLASSVLLEYVAPDTLVHNPNQEYRVSVAKVDCSLEISYINVEGKKFKKEFSHTCFGGSVGWG